MRLRYFFYFLIFFFTTGQLLRINFTNGFVLQATDLAMLVVCSMWFTEVIVRKRFIFIYTNYLFKPMLFFVVAAVLSLVVNSFQYTVNELFVGFSYIIRWVLYACVFFIVRSLLPETKQRVRLFLPISGGLLVIAGFIQYFLYPNLRNLYYLGWDDHLYRLFSTLFDPNFAATMFCLLLLLLLPYIFTGVLKKKRDKYAVIGLFLVTFVAFLLTYSRSGFLMFAVGSTVSLWLLHRRKLIAVLLTLFAIGIFLIPKDLGSSGVELWRTASIVARSQSAIQAITIFTDHPVFGVGFNTYRYAQKAYGYADDTNWEVNHAGAGTDNSFLFVLATMGIVGLSAFLYLWYCIVRKVWVIYKKEKQGTTDYVLSVVLLSSIAGLSINTLFINSLFYTYVLFWMWTLLGMMGVGKKKE